MSCILYYSNFCQHSKKLLQHVSKQTLSKDIHFICIDKRETINDKIFIILPDGEKIIMPANVTKVPAILLLNDNYKVLYGDSIYQFLSKMQIKNGSTQQNHPQQNQPQQNQQNQQQQHLANSEPSCFSFSNSGMISSDNYSFLDMDADSLGTKGTGGTRQMHNYVSLNDTINISTPTDEAEYKTDRHGEMTMEAYQKQRDSDMSNITYKQC